MTISHILTFSWSVRKQHSMMTFSSFPPAGGLDGPDLGEQVVPPPVLHPAQVDDHIHLAGAVVHGVRGHEALGGGWCHTRWESRWTVQTGSLPSTYSAACFT